MALEMQIMMIGIMVFLLLLLFALGAIKDQIERIERFMKRYLEELRKGGEQE